MEAGNRPGTGHENPTHRVGIARRLSTETKQAFKTSEFWMTVAAIAGILIAAAVIKGGDSEGGTDEFIASQAWLYVAIILVGYNIGRGAAKSGSREPYTDDDSSSRR